MVSTAITPEEAEEGDSLVLDLVDECYYDACEVSRVDAVTENDDGSVDIVGKGLKGHDVRYRKTPAGDQYVHTATGRHDVKQVQRR